MLIKVESSRQQMKQKTSLKGKKVVSRHNIFFKEIEYFEMKEKKTLLCLTFCMQSRNFRKELLEYNYIFDKLFLMKLKHK